MGIASFQPARATLDEFAIYDFGPHTGAGQDGIYFAEMMAQERYAAGRFYKESDYSGLGKPGNSAGEWFSAPVDLGFARLRSLSWTQIVPRGLKGPAPAGWPSPPDPAKPEDGDPGPQDYPGSPADPNDYKDGRIVLELAQSATVYAPDSEGRAINSLFSDSRGSAWTGGSGAPSASTPSSSPT